MAAQFIAVILASAIIETIPITRWIGIVLIFVGILVVSLTTEL